MMLARILSALVLAATPMAAVAQDAVVPIASVVPVAPQPASIAAIRADDRIVGSMDAPVTLTAYLSTTCSHCARWHNEALPAIAAKYVETGLVRIVYRDLPTTPQQIASAGAVMARCVPADRFDAALDSLYRGQAALHAHDAEEQRQKTTQWLAAAGTSGGLTREQMNACFGDDANWDALDARVVASQADGVTGTPTFFVNGHRAPVWDVASFDIMIQPLLTAH